MRALPSLAALVALILCAVAPALAQLPRNEYERQFGEPIDVSLDLLADMPETYRNRTVRTSGMLEMLDNRAWGLGRAGVHILIVPVRDVASRFDAEARTWMGRDIEITGTVTVVQDPIRSSMRPVINFWAFLGPEEEDDPSRPPAPEASLEDLVTRPGQYDGEQVRVVGQFRGANLFGDLPSRSRRRSSDWVIKNEVFAAWVTGKKPRGKGWKLDPELRRDTGKWIAVEGRVRTVNGVVYLSASRLALSKAPTPTARAQRVEPPPPPPLKPPVVVFSLPLDGERNVPPDTIFKVQFSNDMDEESFAGRVGLRYAGRPRPGDRKLDAVSMSYDGGRRALIIDPGDLLRAGRTVELILLPGIVDIDGQQLEPRPGHDPGGAAEVLRFQVAGTLASGPMR